MEEETPDLLPCPFCGAIPKLFEQPDGIDNHSWDIKCGTNNCYMEYGADWFIPKRSVVIMWNRRGIK